MTKEQQTKEVERIVKGANLIKKEIAQKTKKLNKYIADECAKIDVKQSLIKSIIK